MMNLTTSNLLNMNPIDLDNWYKKWREGQIELGNILVKPSPELLTTWYAEQVVNGGIKASKKVIQAGARHLRDLERQGTDDFPYIFDIEKGHRPIRFMEKFCKPSKGDFKQLILQAWQHFVIGSIYGWVHRDTGIRRFREALVFVGRKNGKTTLISGLSLYSVSKDNEPGARVYVLANSKQQAGELFDEARAMVQSSPKLRKNMRENQKGIFFDKTKSKIEPRASDSKKLDGLNTHMAVFDEIHEFLDYKLINVIKKSRGSRIQPTIIYITTAGYQLEGPLVEYYEQSADVLEGSEEDERTFYFMAELDDEKEFEYPEEWIKANPSIGVSLNLPNMIVDWKKDKRTPEERSDYITKQFNFFSDNSQQSYLDYQTIRKNNKEIDTDILLGQVCVGGFDLSDSEDFTSACLEFVIPGTTEIFVLSHSWVPKNKVLLNKEKIPYESYVEQGLMTVCDTPYIDYQLIYDWFVEKSKLYQIEMITYDRANAFRLVEDLKAYGFTTEKVIQGYVTLSPALKDLKTMFVDGKVVSNNNRLFRWYVNNVQLVEDRNKNKIPTKQAKYKKIDGFAALLNSHTKMMEKLLVAQSSGNIGMISLKDLMR